MDDLGGFSPIFLGWHPSIHLINPTPFSSNRVLVQGMTPKSQGLQAKKKDLQRAQRGPKPMICPGFLRGWLLKKITFFRFFCLFVCDSYLLLVVFFWISRVFLSVNTDLFLFFSNHVPNLQPLEENHSTGPWSQEVVITTKNNEWARSMVDHHVFFLYVSPLLVQLRSALCELKRLEL